MQEAAASPVEGAALAVLHRTVDEIYWRARWKVEKYVEDIDAWLAARPGLTVDDFQAAHKAYETIEKEGNLLVYGGMSCLFQTLIGNGTATAGQNLTYFNNGNAAVGVGDSATAAAATQTDLQAATNKLRKGMEATYPQHTDGTTSASDTITFKSSFGTSEANWVWNEWGVFNSPTAATGRMLNRKVESLGTKSSGTWVLTVTVQLSP